MKNLKILELQVGGGGVSPLGRIPAATCCGRPAAAPGGHSHVMVRLRIARSYYEFLRILMNYLDFTSELAI